MTIKCKDGVERKVWKEVIRESMAGIVTASELVEPTEEDIARNKSKCDHEIIYDVDGWMYDERNCAICGKGLGLI